MHLAETRITLAEALTPWRDRPASIAFVPTMGALHDGHLTLIREAQNHFDCVVASIFVNPTQFDRAADLAAYPRQAQRDTDLLAAEGTQLLFLPGVDEIYPSNYTTPPLPNLAGLDTRYEGEHRPGHFAGVVQVVRRLVELVQPHAMFMGQKDAQQVAVLRRAAAVESWPIEIVSVLTVREISGLAMSSRNGRLSAEGFAQASLIYVTLQWGREAWLHGLSSTEVTAEGLAKLRWAGFDPEYFDVVDADTFEPITGSFVDRIPAARTLLITVAWLEGVRLIDNLAL